MDEQSEREWLWGAAVLGTLRAFDAVVEINSVGVVTQWNGVAQELFGVRSNGLTGEITLGEIVSETYRFELDTAIMAAGEPSEAGEFGWRGELHLLAQGVPFTGEVTVIPAPDQIAGSALVIVHVPAPAPAPASAQPSLDDELAETAARLVDLPTFLELLDLAYRRDRDAVDSLAVLRVDIDAAVSDHSDEACRALCRIAGSDDAVTAIDGTGFALLSDTLRAPYLAANLADRIAGDVADALRSADGADGHSVSIGIGFLDDDHVTTSKDIFDHADAAVASARQLGGNRWEVFDERLRENIAERRRFRDELYGAIDAGDFRVHYQPADDVDADRITMVEALVRWDHPTRGLVAAGEFVDLAEESGLMLPLGAWVLNEACRQLRAWLDEFGESAPIVAVNFSQHQLEHETALQLVAGVIEANGLEAGRLCLEFAEGVLLADLPRAVERLHELRALGVRLSIDHFGVAQTSSTALDQFPIDLVKIDRSFVGAIDTSDDAHRAVTTIVETAHSLGIAVAAEGVETEAQLAVVRDLGCDQIQGFHVARPQSPADISSLVADQLAGEPKS